MTLDIFAPFSSPPPAPNCWNVLIPKLHFEKHSQLSSGKSMTLQNPPKFVWRLSETLMLLCLIHQTKISSSTNTTVAKTVYFYFTFPHSCTAYCSPRKIKIKLNSIAIKESMVLKRNWTLSLNQCNHYFLRYCIESTLEIPNKCSCKKLM